MPMRNVKVGPVGGGSYTWTPKLIADVARSEYLSRSGLCLIDLSTGAAAAGAQGHRGAASRAAGAGHRRGGGSFKTGGFRCPVLTDSSR